MPEAAKQITCDPGDPPAWRKAPYGGDGTVKIDQHVAASAGDFGLQRESRAPPIHSKGINHTGTNNQSAFQITAGACKMRSRPIQKSRRQGPVERQEKNIMARADTSYLDWRSLPRTLFLEQLPSEDRKHASRAARKKVHRLRRPKVMFNAVWR